jgi:hypothetical protein
MFVFLLLFLLAAAALALFPAVVADPLAAIPTGFQAGGAKLVAADRASAETPATERFVTALAGVRATVTQHFVTAMTVVAVLLINVTATVRARLARPVI